MKTEEDWVVLDVIKARCQLDEFLKSNYQFEKFAEQFGVTDIYKDSNVKQLQQAIYLGLSFNSSRNSSDAYDYFGNPWELKSLNALNTKSVFTTCNPMTHSILNRYRRCYWAFSVYENTQLQQIYVLEPDALAPYFNKWDARISAEQSLNNPKIKLSFVVEHGCQVYNVQQSLLVADPVQTLIQAGRYVA